MKITFNENIYSNNQSNEYWERQRNSAKKIIDQFNNDYKTMILADEVGMGKTYSALAAMAQFINKKKKVLLIVPAGGVLENKWLEEITNFNYTYLNENTIKFRAVTAYDIQEAISFIDIKNIELKRIRQERKEYFVYYLKKWLKNRELPQHNKLNISVPKSDLKERFYSIYPQQILNKFFEKFFYKEDESNKKVLQEKKINNIITQINNDNYEILKKFSKTLEKYVPNVIIIPMNSKKFDIKTNIRKIFSLAVIDEAHNWKNGARGATDFETCIAPHIENKLLLTATPVQLHANELEKILRHASGHNNNKNNSLQAIEKLHPIMDNCKKCSKEFLAEWKNLTNEQLEKLNKLFKGNQNKTKKIIEQIDDNELINFRNAFLTYNDNLITYEKELKKIVIRHNKSKEKRYFHCGNDFDKKNQNKPHYLYEAKGYTDQDNQLLTFIGMRAQQLITRKNTQHERVCLLGGINSSYEAFNQYFETNKTKINNDRYMNFFMEQIKNSKHPKVTTTVERAYNNLIIGKKTLIFCERIATQEKIEIELKSKIINASLEHSKNNKKQFNDTTEQLKNEFLKQISQGQLDNETFQTIKEQAKSIIDKISMISICFNEITPDLPNIDITSFYKKLINHIEIKEIHQIGTKSYHIWNTIINSQNKLVNIINGNTDVTTRVNRCTGFNSPLAPYVLICTAIGSEGIDLHQYCDDIIIHDLPWNPAKLEQKIGRIDRIKCLAEKEKGDNKIGIPFLANDYDELQYKILLSRAQMQEILFGDFLKSHSTTKIDYDKEYDETDEKGKIIEINSDTKINIEKQEVQPLPQQLIDFLTLDLSVKKNEHKQ